MGDQGATGRTAAVVCGSAGDTGSEEARCAAAAHARRGRGGAGYNQLGLTQRDHPLTFLREDLQTRGIISCRQALAAKDGKRLTVAGLVLVRQRPGSAEGVVFMTLEDETANMNVIIWPDMFDANRRVVLGGQTLAVTGMLQKEGDVVHLLAKEITDLSGLLADVGNRSSAGSTHDSNSAGERIVVTSRNFH